MVLDFDGRWLGLALALAVACTEGTDDPEMQEPDGPDPLASEDPLHDAEVRYAEAWCACQGDASGYADAAECNQRRSGAATDACEAEVLFGNAAAEPRLRCLVEATDLETACLAAADCSDPMAADDECQAQENEARQQCPAYPDDVTAALEACNEPEPWWMVGDGGTVLGIGPDGDAAPETQATSVDLLAITCDGEARAWIVGESGQLLRTIDGGATWSHATIDAAVTLRAVAQVHGAHVLVAGDDGVLFESQDQGAAWSRVEAPIADFTGIAPVTDEAWLLTAMDGSIWRYRTEQGFEPLRPAGGTALRAVASSLDGRVVAAVGDVGTVLTSDDAGHTWRAEAVPTRLDLHAVDVAGLGDDVIAVGSGGVIVRLDEQGARSQRLPPRETLFGVHLTAEGHGGLVGDAGTFAFTRDGGETWTVRDVGTAIALRGLDQPLHDH